MHQLLSLALLLFISATPAQLQADAGGFAAIGGDFILEGVNGQVSLSDFKGSVVLVYFGYTRCPDVCPTTLAAISAAIDELPKDAQRQVQAIFISLDPERDTLESLSNYVKYFHPRMLGLSGSQRVIADVARKYGVNFRKVPDEHSAMGYTLDHTAFAYVVDRDGVIKGLIPHGASIEEIVEKINSAL